MSEAGVDEVEDVLAIQAVDPQVAQMAGGQPRDRAAFGHLVKHHHALHV